MKARKNSKYSCANCGEHVDSKWVDAMIKAGFEARHLDCPSCGQQAIKENTK